MVGVESAHGFGDGLFNVALIRAISEQHNTPVGVAVRPHCQDAFKNVPWISEIIPIHAMHHGQAALQHRGYTTTYQITQNVKFFEFREKDPQHSLIDTPLCTGLQLGLPAFDQRPIFIPTQTEMAVGARYTDMPNIAIESVYTSGQSWSDDAAWSAVLQAYPNHRIIWLSNSGAPTHPYMDNMLRWTRRETICALPYCDVLFASGSGFFCASLTEAVQPKRIVCLWRDELYRYEKRLSELNWHTDITWVHDHAELRAVLQAI